MSVWSEVSLCPHLHGSNIPERFLYQAEGLELTRLFSGSHITPVIRYVDDIIFEKLQDDQNYCKLKGHSFSTVSKDVTF